MALNFPSPAYDGEIYVDPTSGSKYVYVAASTKWMSIQHIPVTTAFGFNKANSAYLTANAAYDMANAAYNSQNVDYTLSNSAFTHANAAYKFSNSAYASINSNWTVTNALYSVANSAFDSANNVGPQIAPTYNTANAAFDKANTFNYLSTANANTVNAATSYVVDSFSTSLYRTVKYLIQGVITGNVHSTEILLTHNDTDAFLTEYASIFTSDIELYTVSANVYSNNVNLIVVPNFANTTIDLSKIQLLARSIAAPAGGGGGGGGGGGFGTTWTTSGNMTTPRHYHAGFGTQSAAMAVAGLDNYVISVTAEVFDGSTWSSISNINTQRKWPSATGTTTAGMCISGVDSSGLTLTSVELYNGSTWSTSGASLIAGAFAPVSFGTQSSAMSVLGQGTEDKTQLYNGTSWSFGADTITGRYNAAGAKAAAVSSAFVFNGTTNIYAKLYSSEQYDGTAWSTSASTTAYHTMMPAGFGNQSSCAVACGTDATGLPSRTTELFNGTSWSTSGNALIDRVWIGAAGSSAAAGAIFGGLDGATWMPTTSTELFN